MREYFFFKFDAIIIQDNNAKLVPLNTHLLFRTVQRKRKLSAYDILVSI